MDAAKISLMDDPVMRNMILQAGFLKGLVLFKYHIVVGESFIQVFCRTDIGSKGDDKMKVAVGMRKTEEILDTQYLQFLRQIGVTHVIGFMPGADLLPSSQYGYWSEEDLERMVHHYESNGLILAGIENFRPEHWYEILLDTAGRSRQMENLKRTIAAMGKAGLSFMGYNFSIGGVIGQRQQPDGRTGAVVASFDYDRFLAEENTPIPASQCWKHEVLPQAKGFHKPVSRKEMRQRLYRFLEEILPVAEEAGVQMAAHPEDPPLPVMRQMGRVLTEPAAYDEMFERFPTPYCTVEFCQETFTEMGVDVYEQIARYASQKRISYVHLRNVRGKLPHYSEVLIDEGDVDMARALKTYAENGFDGPLIPDHYPSFAGAPSSHAAVAYCIAYIWGLLQTLDLPIWEG